MLNGQNNMLYNLQHFLKQPIKYNLLLASKLKNYQFSDTRITNQNQRVFQ